MNKQDYEWIRQSRNIVFDQCRTLTDEELTKDFGFALGTIKETLIHITKAYRNWIGSFLLGNEIVGDYSPEQLATMDFAAIENLYALVDRYIYEAIDQYEASLDVVMSSQSHFKIGEQKTPHHLLLHTMTHEFHHKGQVTAMLHLLGYTPNNINMVQFDSVKR